MTMFLRKPHKNRGSILLNVLIFLIVISILIAGMANLMLSDYSIVKVENDYSNSLVVAEAGINYELRKISNDDTTADQKNATGQAGTSYTTAAGTFQVYITQRNPDGTEPTPWTPGKNLWIYSTGGVHNLKRSVKVAAVAYTNVPTANYAVFGVSEGLMNGSATTVNGDVGTNGFFNFNGHPTVTGNVTFNGSGSNWQSPPNGTYAVVHNANPVNWPTVETLAVTTFGSQGLSYVAAHNDNALASPAISSNTVLINGNGNQTFFGKPGGANYYMTSLTCNGNAKVVFNNTNGPIYIWFGPSGTSGTFVFNGGIAAIKMTSDPTRAVRIYLATTNDVILNGNSELDAGIYNVNNSATGRVIFNGTPNIYGTVIGNKFTFNGNPTVSAIQGYFSPTGSVLYYGSVPPWQEVGGVN
jgi:Tfp pilus assembly protein PilX